METWDPKPDAPKEYRGPFGAISTNVPGVQFGELMPEQAPAIDRAPSTYFHGRCFLTAEPEDRMIPYVMRGEDGGAICFASDYCHFDCAFPDSVRILAGRADLDAPLRQSLFAGNAAKLYRLARPS